MTYRYPRYRYYGYRYRRGLTGKQAAGAVAVAVAVALAGVTAATGHHHSNSPQLAQSAQPGSQVAAAISFARHQTGCPYVYGGTGPCPAGYDCSGLMMMAYRAAGVTIARTSGSQWATLRHVTSPHRGDLVFFAGADGTPASPGHVGLVLRVTGRDSGVMIQAYDTGTNVMISTYGTPGSLEGVTNPVGFARPVPLVATATAVSYTATSWASAFLQTAGYRRTPCNLAAVTAWEHAEGSNRAWRNPLDDTRPEPGSQPVNSKHVQSYTSWGQGLSATAATLRGPDYGSIRAALAAANDAQAVAGAVSTSVWGTEPFAVEC